MLVTGGSGYLGQFLVQDLGRDHKVGFTHHSTSLSAKLEGTVQEFWVDLKTGEGVAECLEQLGPVDAVINCAAISQPGVVEKDPTYARRCNIPTELVEALKAHAQKTQREPLLIHLSTDQVYDGTKSWWKEADPTEPVNAYGRTKLEAEQFLEKEWPKHVVLRSSIIYGPQSPAPVSRSLFVQFIDSALGSGKETTFFEDEFRCPVYVRDIVTLVRRMVESSLPPPHKVYNLGGPQRLSRVDMARFVAGARGYDQALIKPVPSASVQRGVASPPDISMNIMRLMEDFQMSPYTFMDALEHMGWYSSTEDKIPF